MRPARLTLSLALTLALLGCATERPTRPNAVVPTLRLSDEIVYHLSEPFSDTAYADESLDEIGLNVPESLYAEPTNSQDIIVSVVSRAACGLVDTRIWNYRDSLWQVTIGNDAPRFCLGYVNIGRMSLVPYASDVFGAFLGSDRILRVRGDFRRVEVRIAVVNPDYRPIPITVDSRFAIAEAVGNGIVTEFWTHELGRGLVDSLVWFALDGNRTKAIELPQRLYSQALLWTGSQLWTLTHGESREFGVIFDNGTYSTLFVFLPPGDSRSIYENAATWVEGRIWIPYVRQLEPGVYRMAMMVIDPEQSVALGHTVFEEPLNLDSTLHTPFELAYHDGSVLMHTAERFARLNLRGEITDELPLPVYAQSITSDGEALWIVHLGPREANVDTPLLSRFTLE